MATPVVTVASGGLPVVDVSGSRIGLPVSEAVNAKGLAVTKVAKGGIAVNYVAAVLTQSAAPVPQTAVVAVPAAVSVVTLTFSNALTPSPLPSPVDFPVVYNFVQKIAASVAISGTKVILTFDADYGTPTTAVVSYVPGVNPLKGAGGTPVAAFDNFPITV